MSRKPGELRKRIGSDGVRETVRAMDVFEDDQPLQVAGTSLLSKLTIDTELKEVKTNRICKQRLLREERS